MSPDQERRLEEIFSAARNLPPRDRTAFLERACGGDADLRWQADSLLAAHEQAVVSRNHIKGLLKADSGATLRPSGYRRQRVQLI